MNTLLQDIRYALRMLFRSPGFTAVAVLTLALGIGANTAIFSMVNALLLHPYRFHDLDRLVKVWEDRGEDPGFDGRLISAADALDLRANAAAFADLTLYSCGSVNLTLNRSTEHALACRAAANFFEFLGEQPAMGRTFLPEEEQPGRDQVAVLSHGFWERRFGGDAGVLGRAVQIDGRSYTVIGVMPAQFDYPVPMELWTPLALAPAEKRNRTDLSFEALARLRPGVSVTAAQAELAAFSQRLARAYPRTNTGRRVTSLQLRKELYMYTLPLFSLLQAAAGFVLLLACANLTNLLFARMIARQKEIAVRVALGAGRNRLVRLFVTEATLLSLLGGAAAIAVSVWAVGALRASISPDWTKWVPGWDGMRVDPTVLTFTIALGIAVGMLFGLATALHSGRVDLNKTLKESGPGSMTCARVRVRSALVVTQVVFALVLLVCGGLMMQGFDRIAAAYQGFDPAGVYRTEISLPDKGYDSDAKISSFYTNLLRETAALPGVQTAGMVTDTPASNVDAATTLFTIEGRPVVQASETPSASILRATAGYFETMRIPMVSGRAISASDALNTARVAVVSQSFARLYWPGKSAIGQRIKLGANDSASPWMTIVGVAGDVRQNWWNPPAMPAIYVPFFQMPRTEMTLVVRTASNPTRYAAAIRGAVQRIDSSVALTAGGTMESEIIDSIGILRMMGILMGVFGLVALGLSSVGVYGVVSESVAQRTHEIGIRLALGARPQDVMRLILAQSLKLAGIGIAIALSLSYWAGRAMANLMFGIVSADFAILGGFTALLVGVALVASYIPARRAMRVDPMVALRYE